MLEEGVAAATRQDAQAKSLGEYLRAKVVPIPVDRDGIDVDAVEAARGAKALYLGNTVYRIHGTNNPRSIGRASSSGCFRMLNGHVVDLASRIGVGTSVVVVNRLSREVASARIRR